MGRQLETKGTQAEQSQEQEVSDNQDIESLETSGEIDVDGIDPGERAEVNALLNFDRSIRASFDIGSNIGEDAATATLGGVGSASIRESYTIGSNIGEDAAAIAEEAREAMKIPNGMTAQEMSRASEAALGATKAAMGLGTESEVINERSGMATQSMERQNEAALSAMKAAMGFDTGTGVSKNDSARATQESTQASEAVLEAAAAAVLNAKKDEFE